MTTQMLKPAESMETGAAGTREWLGAIEGMIISAYDVTIVSSPSMLSAAPLTEEQIDLGQQIARKHGLTK